LHATHVSPVCVTCPTNQILLDLITWTLFGVDYYCLPEISYFYKLSLITGVNYKEKKST
jgi:hypothetical protein